ncbi:MULTISPECIES: adenylate/guanylate cyclase domain-containing protein [unclassified Bradyrhizobium]|uniref:adenylate/guanylate cyclase domain-containing protein n=1 Tax=unclassified Bradyrhizobium TaxID=2631580 RepID=UPI00247A8E7B|nr:MULTISPECIES: adenylate/guanylate cyclase domain-containing protein [unclassified Bradyrhizobium]WGS20230.1 adenylate/guanylate cyclase domain-containing protein [Bradyrhizobium sp. ISRA463]WGS27099.1 adenylate/guanylate cyclase domain-containing protein [Bradyrhizobium sp. ISRA464]
MDVPGPERRLAAVLAADMVGYSRLMEADETGTLARLKTHRIELIDPAITKNRGRIIKTTGDGMLVEFHSVVDAVLCAAEVQRRMAKRNTDVAPARWMQFRIGINLGDVIVDGNDIFGDGVNVASRLETLAEPGGICVSAAVRDQVGDRLEDLSFEDIGDQTVKNIVRPIRVFRIRLESDSKSVPAHPQGTAAPSVARKPSIAVLPLVNMSGDPEQEFFADGLTEDIITELSRFHDLLVISRNSTFVYKGKAVKVQDVAKEFAVDYVLEGSVRKAGGRIRVTVQLIDAEADRHVWAERYDRELADIFAIQDEMTRAIVATLPGRVEAAAHDRVKRKPTDNMAAYECVLAAKILHHRSAREDNAEAQRLLERAIALDPNYAHAHAWRACVLGQTWVYNWCDDRDATFEQVAAELEIALKLDDNDSDVHRILAALNLNRDDHDKATFHQERALALNPNYDLVVVQQGELLTWLGRPEEGTDWIKRAMRLNPYHPERFWSHLGRACYCAEKYADAADAFSRITRPDHTHHAFLAATLAQMGNAVAAGAHAAEVLKREPTFSVAAHLATQHYKHELDRARYEAGLLKAGLPA